MNTKFFKDGFYDSRFHLEIPQDAISVSDELYSSLITGQSSGQQIVIKGGAVVLTGEKVVCESPRKIEVLGEILALELKQNRPLRNFILTGDPAEKAHIQEIENQIQALRLEL